MGNFPTPVEELTRQSVTDLFKGNYITNVVEDKESLFSLNGYDYCAIIGYAGVEMKGTMILGASKDLLRVTHASIHMGMEVEDADLPDWLGELANQLVGRIKNGLLSYGLDFGITTPTVLGGNNMVSFNLDSDSRFSELTYKLDDHRFSLHTQLKVFKEIEFKKVETEEVEEEGSSLFF